MIRVIFSLLTVLLFPVYFFGQTAWTPSTPLPQENDIYTMCRIPGTTKVVAVGGGATLMFSDDMAETWQLQLNPAGLPNSAIFRQVYFYNSNLGFISGYHNDQFTDANISYILKTTDGGTSWAEITILPNNELIFIKDFCFLNSETGFMISSSDFYKSSDGGESWEILEVGASHAMNAIDFVNDSTGFIVMSETNEMLKTTNYGNDWSSVNFVSPVSDLGLQNIRFLNNTTGYAVHSNGQILKTSNAGSYWQLVYSGDTNYAQTCHFFDENHGVAVGVGYQNTFSTSIISTNDGGQNWQEFVLPAFCENTISVCCYDASTFLYGGMYGLIFKSTDAGNGWMPMYERELWGDIYQAQYLDDNTIICLSTSRFNYPYTSSILYKSEDGGESFMPMIDFLVLDQDVLTPAAFHFMDHENGFLAYYKIPEDLLAILKTDDGGLTWDELEAGNYDGKPYAIDFYDQQNGLICGEGGFILKTADGGESWEEVYDTPYSYYLTDIYYFDQNEIIVTGLTYWNSYTSKLVVSHDGGFTWIDKVLGDYGIIYDIEVIQ